VRTVETDVRRALSFSLARSIRSPPSKHVSVKQWKKLQEKWHTSLGQAIEWKKTKGKWPKVNRKGDREEQRLYDFLYRSTPGENGWTKDRWAKLNAAFGEGWEMDCFPCLGTGGLLEKGHQRNPRDEIKWDATLADLVRFEKDNGRFPKDKGGESERKLYYWLYNTSDTSGTMYSKERAAKLDAAFGDRWQSRAFPKSFYYW